MAKIIEEGKHKYWLDGDGLKTPEKLVHDADKRRDKMVERLVARANRLGKLIAQEKAIMDREIQDYLGDTAKREGEEWVGGTTIYSYSMDKAVSIKVAKRWTFDERLQIAKTKIDKCIENWSGNANSKLVALVNRAFRVDQKGDVDARQIIGLRTLKIDDALWQEAMNLIADSQKVQGTKTYFYFQQAGEDGKLESIVLDFAAL